MMQQLRKDDVLIIWRLDRLARSTKMLLEIIEHLKDKGASFKSLTEPWADTTSATGKLVMTVLAGLSESFCEIGRMQDGKLLLNEASLSDGR